LSSGSYSVVVVIILIAAPAPAPPPSLLLYRGDNEGGAQRRWRGDSSFDLVGTGAVPKANFGPRQAIAVGCGLWVHLGIRYIALELEGNSNICDGSGARVGKLHDQWIVQPAAYGSLLAVARFNPQNCDRGILTRKRQVAAACG
jgi:hypothetical protein